MEMTGKSRNSSALASSFGLLFFFLILSICISVAVSASINPENREEKVEVRVKESSPEVDASQPQLELVGEKATHCVLVTDPFIIVYRETSTESTPVFVYLRGRVVERTIRQNDWYKTKEGWIQIKGIRNVDC